MAQVHQFVIASAVTDLVGNFLNSSATATIESVLHDAIQQQGQVKDYNLASQMDRNYDSVNS